MKKFIFVLKYSEAEFFKSYLFIYFKKERERDIKRNIDLLFPVFMPHWLILARALTGDRTHNFGLLGRCSNRLSCLAGQEAEFLSFLCLPQLSCSMQLLALPPTYF